MGLLASLLPGVRELRAPFAAGALWLATIYFLIPDVFNSFTADPTVAAGLKAVQVSGITSTVLLGAIAYLLGQTAQGTIAPAVRFLGSRVLRLGVWLDSKRTRLSSDGERAPLRRPYSLYRTLRALQVNIWPLTSAGRGLIIDAVQSRLSRSGVPGSASLLYPFESLLDNLQVNSSQLASTAPLQYQEYDRLNAEIELRLAVTPALVALASVIPLPSRVVPVAIASFVAVVLLTQAAKNVRDANDLIATAAYLEHLKLPALEGIASELDKLVDKPSTKGSWIAAMVLALNRIGQFEESRSLLEEATFLDDEEDRLEVLRNLPADSWERELFEKAEEERRSTIAP